MIYEGDILKKYLIVIMIALLLCGCSRTDDKLIMATEAAFAPYEYYSDGEIKGVDVDIMKAVADRLGKELKVKDVAFDSIIAEVKTGKSALSGREKEVKRAIAEGRVRYVEYRVE